MHQLMMLQMVAEVEALVAAAVRTAVLPLRRGLVRFAVDPKCLLAGEYGQALAASVGTCM